MGQASDNASGRDIALEEEEDLSPEGLIFEDEVGQIALVGTQAIAQTFELFADQVDCVVLNACYSETQAREIAQYIPYVIGMSRAIEDKAAITFAKQFYYALGSGKNFRDAFNFGINQMRIEGLLGETIPTFISSKPRPSQIELRQSISDENHSQLHNLSNDDNSRDKIQILSKTELLQELRKNKSKIGYQRTHYFLRQQTIWSFALIVIPLIYIFILIDLLSTSPFWWLTFVFGIFLLLSLLFITGILYRFVFAIYYFRGKLQILGVPPILTKLLKLDIIQQAVDNWKSNISHTKVYDVLILPVLLLHIRNVHERNGDEIKEYTILIFEGCKGDFFTVRMEKQVYESHDLNLEEHDTGIAYFREAPQDNLFHLEGFVRILSWKEYQRRRLTYLNSPENPNDWGAFPLPRRSRFMRYFASWQG